MSHASERKKLERRAYYQRYPCFVLDDASCADKSEQFVEAIRQAASKVRFDAPETGLKLGNLECLKLFKKVGYDGVRQAMGDMPMHMVTQLLHLTAGEALIRVVDERDPTILDRFAPFSTALVQPTSNVFLITIHELTSRTTRLGHAFLHQQSPLTLSWEGRTYQIAFSRHALQRFRDRLYPRGSWRNYGALGDIYAMLGGNVVIRHIATPRDDSGRDEPLLAIYFFCCPGLFHLSPIPENVLDGIDCEAHDCFVLAGYAPCSRDSDLLVAKTLLSPGMRGTPEDHLMREHLDLSRRAEMEQTLNSLYDYRVPLRYDLLRWLHAHGAVQVVARPRVRLDRMMFDWEESDDP